MAHYLNSRLNVDIPNPLCDTMGSGQAVNCDEREVDKRMGNELDLAQLEGLEPTGTPPLAADSSLVQAHIVARTKKFGTTIEMEERLEAALQWCERRRREELGDLPELVLTKMPKPKFRRARSPSARQPLSPKARFNILKRDGFKCAYCGRNQLDGVVLHVDHIIPVSKGGKDLPKNLTTSCRECNLGKGNRDV